MSDEQLLFKKNTLISKLFYANGIMMFLLSILKLTMGKNDSAIMNFISAIVWIVLAMLYNSIPYCSITDSEIKIIAGLKRFTKTCKWSDILDVKKINKNKFKLITASKKDLTISLFAVDKKERYRLVDAIQKKLQQTI